MVCPTRIRIIFQSHVSFFGRGLLDFFYSCYLINFLGSFFLLSCLTFRCFILCIILGNLVFLLFSILVDILIIKSIVSVIHLGKDVLSFVFLLACALSDQAFSFLARTAMDQAEVFLEAVKIDNAYSSISTKLLAKKNSLFICRLLQYMCKRLLFIK